jgi:hypothetical protein
VEILCMVRANPVENPTAKKIVRADPAGTARVACVDGAFAIRFA